MIMIHASSSTTTITYIDNQIIIDNNKKCFKYFMPQQLI